MSVTTIHKNPTDVGSGHDSVCQVVLYNDSVNDCVYVMDCLMRIFGHSVAIAEKVMYEAHTKGRAVAEVEEAEKARAHVVQLAACNLKAAVERI